MFRNGQAFSGYSVDDIKKAEEFYGQLLGLDAKEEIMGLLSIKFPSGHSVILYPKDDHQPSTYTVLNFPVEDIDAAVDDLTAKGIEFLRYEGFEQDEKGIARSDDPEKGPSIAWFKDPAGNILSVLK